MFYHLPPTATTLSLSDLLAPISQVEGDKSDRFFFETLLTQQFQACSTLAVASGRTALRLILETLKANPISKKKQEIVLPAYTCPVLVKVIYDAGLNPVLCDIDDTNLEFDGEQLNSLVSDKTLAIINVHPFGIPLRTNFIIEIAKQHGVFFIDDICQALGSDIQGQPVGLNGKISFTSFGPGKSLSLGGGGAVFVNDASLGDSIKEEAEDSSNEFPLIDDNFVGSTNSWLRLIAYNTIFQPKGWWIATRMHLHKMGDDSRNWGYTNKWLSISQSRIGLRALDHLDKKNAIRIKNARMLQNRLADYRNIRHVEIHKQSKPIYLRYPIIVQNPQSREMIFDALWQAGIGVGKMYRKTLAEWFPELNIRNFPGATNIAENLITLPTHEFVQIKHIKRIAETIESY